MKKKHKVYLRLNLISILFIAISFISVTLAWFAYSGIVGVKTEVGVKAWHIELEKDGQVVSNDIVISLSDIYPGMDTVNETVNIKNLGDSDARVKYSITSARILGNPEDDYKTNEEVTSPYVEDLLSHEYPFHININLSKGYVLSKGTESSFGVSISWPLDSDNDELDSIWGSNAYNFQKEEETKKSNDPNYQIRPSIQVVISLTAEQYIEDDEISDPKYNLGDEFLIDVINKTYCSEVSSTCLKTHVIDVNNKLNDDKVTLLLDPSNIYLNDIYNNYNSSFNTITNDWQVETRPLLVEDILNIISTDITNSVLIRNDISNLIIGNLKYNERINTELNRAISYNGYYSFLKDKFSYLYSDNCYWLNSEYDSNNAFAIKKIDDINIKLYNENKTTNCNIVPVIIANKSDL